MRKVVCIVGMAGSGKSVVSSVFEEKGFVRVRFGDVTDGEIKKRGLPINEENERKVREQLRKELGMAAYAILNQPRIEQALQHSDVALDGLYSWEEYEFFKNKFGANFYTVAVWASPATRYSRLKERKIRPLTSTEAASRDKSELENLHKGGPIAMADFTINNESTPEYLQSEAERIINKIRQT